MAIDRSGQPPTPGELWILDSSWKSPFQNSNSDKKIALVLKELCENGSVGSENEYGEWCSNPLDPIYRSLVDGQVVDLHWSWFKRRLSQI